MSSLASEPLRGRHETVPQHWRRLAAYLAEHGMRLDIDPPPQQFAGGFANLNYLVRIDGRDAVLRRPPRGPLQTYYQCANVVIAKAAGGMPDAGPPPPDGSVTPDSGAGGSAGNGGSGGSGGAGGDVLAVGQGSLYPALHRLEQQGWIEAEWRDSDLGREAKFYSLTPEGRRQLRRELAGWRRLSSAVHLVIERA
jgi:hypothetical protein